MAHVALHLSGFCRTGPLAARAMESIRSGWDYYCLQLSSGSLWLEQFYQPGLWKLYLVVSYCTLHCCTVPVISGCDIMGVVFKATHVQTECCLCCSATIVLVHFQLHLRLVSGKGPPQPHLLQLL